MDTLDVTRFATQYELLRSQVMGAASGTDAGLAAMQPRGTGLALLLRWPYLQDVPRYTDELQEILWSLDIARGQMLPLTAVDSYYGPLWSYLLAGLFALFGPSPYLPRIIAAVSMD